MIDFSSLSGLELGRRRTLRGVNRLTVIGATLWLALLLAVGGAIIAVVAGLQTIPLAEAASVAVLLAALSGAWFVASTDVRIASTDLPVVVMGDGPLASVVSSALGSRNKLKGYRGRVSTITRVLAAEQAETLMRGSSDQTVVISALEPDALRGSRFPAKRVVPASDVLIDLIGRVPLDLVPTDRWLQRLGDTVSIPAGHRIFKRSLDVMFAIAIGIPFLIALPLLALAIRLESPGPVFFRQSRVGWGNRPFTLIKLRTMRVDAERLGAQWATEGDSRVTRIGRLLRRSRMDELPQIWNILRGDMTLIGPRPERPEFTQLLEKSLPCYAKRHVVRPGLTGWAQVRYRYASSIQDSAVKLEHDLYYVKRLTPALDIRILLLTVQVVFGLRGR